MPQSLVRNYIHIIFSTKNRHPFIDKNIKDELFSYLAGICKNNECTPIIVGGYNDHVHILCLMSQKIALMKLVEHLKTHSSKWIKTKGGQYENFYWQKGYGAFSVNPSQVEIVKNYIKNQQEHHRKKSFKDEYEAYLRKYKIDYNEKYVWD